MRNLLTEILNHFLLLPLKFPFLNFVLDGTHVVEASGCE